MQESSETTGLIEKTFLMGLGAASLAKETVTALMDDLVDRGRMSREEAQGLGAWMTQKASEQTGAIRKVIADEVHRAVQTAGLATKEDVQRLESELRAGRPASGPSAGPYVP